MTASTLATIHNERFFVKLLGDIRDAIDGGYFPEFRDETLARFYGGSDRVAPGTHANSGAADSQ